MRPSLVVTRRYPCRPPETARRRRELHTGLPEPIFQGERLRIERDDRVGVAPGRDGPGPIATMAVPLVAKATDPMGEPPLVFHETTGFVSLEMSIAQMPSAAPPHPLLVAA